jgi:hypothetical protein
LTLRSRRKIARLVFEFIESGLDKLRRARQFREICFNLAAMILEFLDDFAKVPRVSANS